LGCESVNLVGDVVPKHILVQQARECRARVDVSSDEGRRMQKASVSVESDGKRESGGGFVGGRTQIRIGIVDHVVGTEVQRLVHAVVAFQHIPPEVENLGGGESDEIDLFDLVLSHISKHHV